MRGPRVERLGMVAQLAVGGDRVDPGYRRELAASLVQHNPHMEERLEPGPEAASRTPHALCDRADPAAIGGVQMDDPIGLAVADRAQHNRLRLQRAGHRFLPSERPVTRPNGLSGNYTF